MIGRFAPIVERKEGRLYRINRENYTIQIRLFCGFCKKATKVNADW